MNKKRRTVLTSLFKKSINIYCFTFTQTIVKDSKS